MDNENYGRLLSYRAVIRGNIVELLNKTFPKNIEYQGNRLDILNFDMSYPLNFSVYPHVEVVYKENSIAPSGLGDTLVTSEDDGFDYHLWFTEGNIELSIRTTNAYEIDLITDGLILALAIDDSLSKELHLVSDYVDMYLSPKELKPGVTSAGGMPIYDSDDVSYLQNISIPIRSQFCVREKIGPDGKKIIESVRITVEDESGNLGTTDVVT